MLSAELLLKCKSYMDWIAFLAVFQHLKKKVTLLTKVFVLVLYICHFNTHLNKRAKENLQTSLEEWKMRINAIIILF